MPWVLGIVVGVVALVLVVPITRRMVVLTWVFVRRLTPVIGRKLRLVGKDYTTARAVRLAFEDLGPPLDLGRGYWLIFATSSVAKT